MSTLRFIGLIAELGGPANGILAATGPDNFNAPNSTCQQSAINLMQDNSNAHVSHNCRTSISRSFDQILPAVMMDWATSLELPKLITEMPVMRSMCPR
jgi:hypothetical protein